MATFDYGDGHDGDATISSNPGLGKEYHDLTINGTITGAFSVKVSGTLTLNCTIDASGSGQGASEGGLGGVGGVNYLGETGWYSAPSGTTGGTGFLDYYGGGGVGGDGGLKGNNGGDITIWAYSIVGTAILRSNGVNGTNAGNGGDAPTQMGGGGGGSGGGGNGGHCGGIFIGYHSKTAVITPDGTPGTGGGAGTGGLGSTKPGYAKAGDGGVGQSGSSGNSLSYTIEQDTDPVIVITFSTPTTPNKLRNTTPVQTTGTVHSDRATSSISWVSKDKDGVTLGSGTLAGGAADTDIPFIFNAPLLQGSNTITVSANFTGGNYESEITVIYDIIPPDGLLSCNLPMFTATESCTIKITGSDVYGIKSIVFQTVTYNGGGATIFDKEITNVPLTGGTQTGNSFVFVATITDMAGNVTSVTGSIIIYASYDDIPTPNPPRLPQIKITIPSLTGKYDAITTPLTISGLCMDTTSIEWESNADSDFPISGTAVITGNFWTSEVSLIKGKNIVVYTATGSTGIASAVIVVTVAETPPTIVITTPTVDPVYETTELAVPLAGTSASDLELRKVEYKVNAGSYIEATGTATWSVVNLGGEIVTFTISTGGYNYEVDDIIHVFEEEESEDLAIFKVVSVNEGEVTELVIVDAGNGFTTGEKETYDFTQGGEASGLVVNVTEVTPIGVPVVFGLNTITAKSTDVFGNEGTDVLTVIAAVDFSIHSGGTQDVFPGEASASMEIELLDAEAVPVEGETITFAITSALGGTLSAATAVTDSSGHASVTFTPALSGANTITATYATKVVTFAIDSTFTFKTSGGSATATMTVFPVEASAALADPILKNKAGSAKQSKTVALVITSGTGTLSAATGVTSAAGKVANTITIASTGVCIVSMSIYGQVFEYTITCSVLFTVVSGNNQKIKLGETGVPFAINLKNAGGTNKSGKSIVYTVTTAPVGGKSGIV